MYKQGNKRSVIIIRLLFEEKVGIDEVHNLKEKYKKITYF